MVKKSSSISPHERQVIAFHEAGHALTSWLLEHSEPLLKVRPLLWAMNIGINYIFELSLQLVIPRYQLPLVLNQL